MRRLSFCHDDRLERTTSGRGATSKLPLAAIRELDAGSWHDGRFAGEHVPTLDETLALCREIGLGANIEIKAERGRGAATAAAAAALLRRYAGRLPPVLISSFLADAVAEAARRAPTFHVVCSGRKCRAIGRELPSRSVARRSMPTSAIFLKKIVAGIGAAGYPVLAYTVNDPSRARQLFDWGVTSVFSDVPDIILAVAALESRDGARQGALA